MSFIWPTMLWTLLLLPVFLVWYIRLQKRRKKLANQRVFLFTQNTSGAHPRFRRHVPPAIFMAGFAIMMVALARPQAVISTPKIQGTVILAFDVSGSMAADDLKPTRMEAAKAAARDFVQRQPSTVQIGVVAFSDNGFSVQPPTDDQAAILSAINRLTPKRGTSLGNGIQAALNTIASGQGQGPLQYSNLDPAQIPTPTPVPSGTYTSAVIVLLTDGDNNEAPDPIAIAQTAAERGVRIYTVGIGSPSGTNVHVNGFTVFTQLDEPTLKQISQRTGGTYYNAETAQDLRTIYDQLDPQLIIKPEKTEITSVFAGASILALLVGGMFSLVWFGRLP